MFFDLLEQAQLDAISSAITPSAESIYRMKARQYSQTFHTPLHLVYELDVGMVLQALCEEQYPPSVVEDELEELLDKLYKLEDPSYTRMTEQETEDLVDMVINHENKRKNKKPQDKSTEKTLLDKNTSENEKKTTPPKQGGMVFENLENEDVSTGGFKDET